MPTLRDITCVCLQHLQERGIERIALDDEAYAIMRSWVATPLPPARPELASAQQSTLSSPEEKIAYLRERAEHWVAARKLGTLRERMVFSVGDVHAQLVLVGEAPGYDEERLGEPFVGKAGQKLDDILRAMGLRREQVYITNICKFRPSMGDNQGTANRAPSADEIAACLPIVQAELRAIVPTCIVCLGASAARGLLARDEKESVTSLRGTWWEYDGTPVRVTYHPSYLLRNGSLASRRAVWEDMLTVMDKLRIPISDKQRNYFLPK